MLKVLLLALYEQSTVQRHPQLKPRTCTLQARRYVC